MHQDAASNPASKLPLLPELGGKLSSLSLIETKGATGHGSDENVADSDGLLQPIKRAEDIVYRTYKDENDLKAIVELIAPYLSEPYSVYCYRYFLHAWCVLAKLIVTVLVLTI